MVSSVAALLKAFHASSYPRMSRAPESRMASDPGRRAAPWVEVMTLYGEVTAQVPWARYSPAAVEVSTR